MMTASEMQFIIAEAAYQSDKTLHWRLILMGSV